MVPLLKSIAQRITVAYSRTVRKASIRAIFHWNISGVIAPFFWGAGVIAAGYHKLTLAYVLFVLAGIWACLSWITSNQLERKRRLLESRKIRRDETKASEIRQSLLLLQSSGLFIIALFTIASVLWFRGREDDYIQDQMRAARDDVFEHLIVSPVTFPITPQLTARGVEIEITNNAHWNIGAGHTIDCVVYAMWNNLQQIGFGSSFAPGHSKFSLGELSRGGRGETIGCPIQIGIPTPIACADFWMKVNFSVKEQPDIVMAKKYRFFYQGNQWHQGNVNVIQNYCGI
jgi:hypothetical protein